ncbi:unnamed protein product [Alopecurus aequalis]
MRLQRHEMGVEDFELLKIIGRGAFGEAVASEGGLLAPNGGEMRLHMRFFLLIWQGAQRQRNWLTDTQRYAVYMSLETLHQSRGGKFKRNDKKNVAALFGTNIRTIHRIWETAKKQKALGQEVDVSNQRKGNCGRKRYDDILALIPTIPLNKRSTIRSLAMALGVSPSTLHKKFKLKKIRRHSSSVKPLLTEANKRARVGFSFSFIDEATLGDASPSFGNMRKIVHMNEKWFIMTKTRKSFYLHPEEEEPERLVQNKNSIGKVMFLTAVARPRYDEHDNVTFSGKIGVWPFVRVTAAKKRAKIGKKGHSRPNVTRDVMREYLTQKVVPAIQALWPADDVGPIFIQQDNARTHILADDPAFKAAVEETGMDIRLMNQPPNSPDMNVLDLGLFSSMQSLTDRRSPRTIPELIKGVQEEFDGYEVANLNKVFISLQTCMVQVMKNGGSNKYKIPHMNKKRLQRLRILPTRVQIPPEVYAKALEILGQDVR